MTGVQTCALPILGGDEFAIVFLKIDGKKASSIMEKIMNIFSETSIEFEGEEHFVSFAFGTSQYPSDGENSKELAKIADGRMYVRKAEMKGACCVIEADKRAGLYGKA